MPSSLIGQILEGKWQIESQLGDGGMGTVFLARDLQLDRTVAIKFLSPRYADNPDIRMRFEREARVMAKLDHPNLVPVYAFGTYSASPFMVMKHVIGKTLYELVKVDRELTLGRVSRMVAQLCDGLTHLHGQGIVHRDIKPTNIIVAEDGHVTLLDYGVARPREGTPMTPQGSAVGTPRYMPPEQAMGQVADARSDLYSLGVLMFELITGTSLYEGVNDIEMLRAHVHTPPPDPQTRNPRVPPALARVVLKALAKNPADRFASAEAFKLAMLEAVETDQTNTIPSMATWDVVTTPHLEAAAPSGPTPFERPKTQVALDDERPNRRVLTVALGAGATALFAGGWYWKTSTAPKERRVVAPPRPPPVDAGALATAEEPPDASVIALPEPRQPKPQPPSLPPRLSLVAGPQWAYVSLDGVRLGQTPKELKQISLGRHEVLFEREGYATVRRTIIVKPGFQTVSVEMKP